MMCQMTCFSSDIFSNVIDKGVHDAHGLGEDTGTGMDLLQHLVLMDAVTLLSAILVLLVALLSGFGDNILGFLVGSKSWLGRLRNFGSIFSHQ